MAAPTAGVPSTTTPFTDTKTKRPLAAAAATYYPGEMIALDASGNAVKCADTAGIQFDGIASDSFRIDVVSGDSAGDHTITTSQPKLFSMYIAAAVAGDEGKPVYAVYSNEVAYSGVSNSILVGYVHRVVDATTVEINPKYIAIITANAVAANTLTFSGSTGANVIAVPDNLADGLSISEGANAYVTIVTTNAAEKINFKKTVGFPGTTGNNIIALTDNLADALNIKEATNSYLKFVTTDSSEAIVLGKAATGVSLAVTAGLTSSGGTGAGIGYATGAGGTVIQITSRATGVTINKLTGTIQTDTTSLAAGAEAEFTVTNSTVAATDTIIVSLASGNSGIATCLPIVTAVAAGSFKICITNQHASTAETGACILNFAVIKGVAA